MSQPVMKPPYDQPETASRERSTYPRFSRASTPAMTSRPGPSPAPAAIARWNVLPRLSLPR